MIFAPRFTGLAWDGFDPRDRLTLHLQVHSRVTIGRGRVGVAEPVADRRQINPGLEEGNGGAVPHGVRVKPLLAEIRNVLAGTVKTPREDVADAESGQGFMAVIQK